LARKKLLIDAGRVKVFSIVRGHESRQFWHQL
jgi:hypothetical protein